MTGISVRLLSRVRTGLQRPLANKQPLSQGKATLIWRMTHIGRQSRPGSPVELGRFLLSSAAGDVYTGATVGGVSPCVESLLCVIFITCMVHGSVDLLSALVHHQMWECWWADAHETVLDSHYITLLSHCPSVNGYMNYEWIIIWSNTLYRHPAFFQWQIVTARVSRCCTGYNTVLVNSEHTQVCAHVTAAHASSAAFSAIPISAVHMSCWVWHWVKMTKLISTEVIA